MVIHLRNQIAGVLATVGANAPALLSRGRAEKLYEVFIMGCVVRALLRIGANVEARDSTDSPTGNLVFRYGPGRIYHPASTPGFLHVRYQTFEYELHTNLQVLGSSRALHELDVCILDKGSAVYCRSNGIDPAAPAIQLLTECKFYGDNLPLRIGREFLGLGSEFSLRIKVLASNVGNVEIHRMVKRHGGTTRMNTTPLETRRVQDFVGWLATELEHVL